MAGCVGSGFTVIASTVVAEVPQALVAKTLSVPDVAAALKLIVIALPTPLIVAPPPL